MDIMSAQLHTMTTTTTTQQQYVKATTPPPPNLPRVDESLYRFFPPTERTKGRPIEGLNAQIACLCSSSTAVLTNNADNIGNRHRRLIENIFHSSQENKITLSDDGAKCVHSPTGHDSVLAGVPQVLCNGEDDDNDEDDAGRSEDLGDRRPQLLFLVRHGQTDMNAAGRLQGRGVNAPLNAAGRQQGDELGEFLHSVPFGTVMSSSLDRAHETAIRVVSVNIYCLNRERGCCNGSRRHNKGTVSASCSSEPEAAAGAGEDVGVASSPDVTDVSATTSAGCRVVQSDGIDELSWGVLEGQDSAREPWKGKLAALKEAWDDGQFEMAAEKGENLLQVEARAMATLESLLDEGQELNLVASHGRVLRILLLSMAGLGLDQMTRMGKIPNTGLYIVEARRSKPGAPRSYRLLTPIS